VCALLWPLLVLYALGAWMYYGFAIAVATAVIQQMEQATTIWEVSRLQGQMASKVTPEQKKKLLLMTVKDLPTQYK
jgi:hypothetical protein